jgi:hypothetical protein
MEAIEQKLNRQEDCGLVRGLQSVIRDGYEPELNGHM